MSQAAQVSEVVSLEYPAPHVALVTIRRPEARNAVNVEVAERLAGLVDQLEADLETRAVVLTGAGGMFSAGADLKVIAAGRGKSLATERGGFAGFVYAPRRKPWIAAVRGAALGGGFEIVLACDLVVAAEDAEFGLPEPSRGLIAGAGGAFRLPQVLPRNVAFELVATAGRLKAARAHELGLVNRLAAGDAVAGAAVELGSAIAANAPLAVQESLALARAAGGADQGALRAATAEAWSRIILSEDAREGPRSFIEKRPPRWTGR